MERFIFIAWTRSFHHLDSLGTDLWLYIYNGLQAFQSIHSLPSDISPTNNSLKLHYPPQCLQSFPCLRCMLPDILFKMMQYETRKLRFWSLSKVSEIKDDYWVFSCPWFGCLNNHRTFYTSLDTMCFLLNSNPLKTVQICSLLIQLISMDNCSWTINKGNRNQSS